MRVSRFYEYQNFEKNHPMLVVWTLSRPMNAPNAMPISRSMASYAGLHCLSRSLSCWIYKCLIRCRTFAQINDVICFPNLQLHCPPNGVWPGNVAILWHHFCCVGWGAYSRKVSAIKVCMMCTKSYLAVCTGQCLHSTSLGVSQFPSSIHCHPTNYIGRPSSLSAKGLWKDQPLQSRGRENHFCTDSQHCLC